jgi:signal transduction histidine kinase
MDSELSALVASVAHELNNPINFVYGNVEFLARYFRDLLELVELYGSAPLPDDVRHAIEQKKHDIEYEFLRTDTARLLRSIRAGAERTAAIVRDLRALTSAGGGPLEAADLIEGVETTLDLITPLIVNRIAVARRYEPDVPRVHCRREQINQVFTNVLVNAAQAIVGTGRITVEVARASHDRVRVCIGDSGPGVPLELRARIFEPFFTTKSASEGTGLGLFISEGIVRKHGGSITIEGAPRDGEGATFVIELPIHEPAL